MYIVFTILYDCALSWASRVAVKDIKNGFFVSEYD